MTREEKIKKIEGIILGSDLWDAFTTGMAVIHDCKKEDINKKFYKDIAKEIVDDV